MAVSATFSHESPFLFNAPKCEASFAENVKGNFTALPRPMSPPSQCTVVPWLRVCLTFKRAMDQRHESPVNDAVRGGVHLSASEAAIGRLIHFLASIIELCLVPGTNSWRARLKCPVLYASLQSGRPCRTVGYVFLPS